MVAACLLEHGVLAAVTLYNARCIARLLGLTCLVQTTFMGRRIPVVSGAHAASQMTSRSFVFGRGDSNSAGPPDNGSESAVQVRIYSAPFTAYCMIMQQFKQCMSVYGREDWCVRILPWYVACTSSTGCTALCDIVQLSAHMRKPVDTLKQAHKYFTIIMVTIGLH